MRLLVLTSEPLSAQQLREAVQVDGDPAQTEVMVVAPALAENPIKFWFTDVDQAIERAERVRSESVRELRDSGIAASGETGESDPVQAIEDALQTFPAERIILFTHPGGRYREDIDEAELRERFGLPVDHAGLAH
jgi:hypothetical protein